MLPSKYSAKGEQASKHNLPAQLTPLLGREQEIADACALLQRPEVRLVTLTGTGGIGKTRLSLAIATNLLADFPDGVSFVSLAPISDPDLVMPTVAQAFGLKETADQSLFDLLKAYLREKHLLLLLDNFEQIVSAAPKLTELLAICPQLKILVTSRAVLHVQGEHEFPIPPLAVPDLAHLPEDESLSHYAAVALFLQRAQAIKPDFRLTKVNARTIAEICARLDGLPLAIELAAARIKLLPPQSLLARLGHRLTVLTSVARDIPERQQTLRNTIQWSYDLLSAEEQRLFRLLSVFVGGCTLEAAEALYSALGNEAAYVLNGVASLIDKSLLQQTEHEEEEPRLTMLETIREYGVERLAVCQEMEVTRRAHAAYYLQLAEDAEPYLRGTESSRWVARLEQEHVNLRAALSWLLEKAGMKGSSEGNKEWAMRALRLCGALHWFWNFRGDYREGWSFLEQALAVREGISVSVQLKVLSAATEMVFILDDYQRAEVLCRETLALSQESGDKADKATALFQLGFIAWARCKYAEARTRLEEALALFQELGDRWNQARSLTYLTRVFAAQGEYDQARSTAEQSLTLSRRLSNKGRIAIALGELARVRFLAQDDFTQTQALAEQSLVLFREMGDAQYIAYSLILLGEIHLIQNEQAQARALLEESVASFKELGDRWSTAEALLSFARLAISEGELVVAHACCRESLALARELGARNFIAVVLEEVGAVVAAQGEPTWPARLWGTAQALRAAIGAPLAPVYRADYERSVATVRIQLGEKAFTDAWAEGQAMTPEQALAAQRQMKMPTSTPKVPLPSYPGGLTAREVEVLRLIARGLTDAQVAQQLVISPRTVNTHLTAIYGKIQVSSRSAATRYAIEHQLV